MSDIQFQGERYSMLDMSSLTPGEAAEVEKVTGLTFQKIRFLGGFCVCEHAGAKHDEETTECKEDCRCEEFAADLPMDVSTALLYVSIKRKNRAVTFADVRAVPYSEFDIEEEDGEVEPDPTQPPREAA